MTKKFRPTMSPTIPAPHASPSVSSEARDDGSGTSESLQQAHYLKLFDVKKGSTEVMVQNLLKKNSSILQKNIVVRDEGTTFLIQYDTTEDAQKVAEEILGEKLNKKSFKVELITSDDAQVLLLPPQHSPPPVVLQESAALFDKDQSALLEALLATHLKNQNPKPKKKTKLSRKNVRFSPTKKSRKLKFKKSSKKVSRQSSQSEQSSSCQTISSDDREDDLQTKEMRSTIRSILQKDPVSRASASQPQQSISFDPKEGLPLPSEVFASKIASLLNNVNTGADQSKPNSGKLSKKKKSKGKKSRRRKSSSSSDSSSSTATSSSSSSSADSARNLRTYYEKLKKKGKLTSGRFRKGLPVVRGEEWPHEMINHALAGKSFSCDDLTAPAFIAGLLNQVIVLPEFEKIHKPKNLLRILKLSSRNSTSSMRWFTPWSVQTISRTFQSFIILLSKTLRKEKLLGLILHTGLTKSSCSGLFCARQAALTTLQGAPRFLLVEGVGVVVVELTKKVIGIVPGTSVMNSTTRVVISLWLMVQQVLESSTSVRSVSDLSQPS